MEAGEAEEEEATESEEEEEESHSSQEQQLEEPRVEETKDSDKEATEVIEILDSSDEESTKSLDDGSGGGNDGVVVETDAQGVTWYQVEAIVGRKRYKKKYLYKVKWAKCVEASWEPYEFLNEETKALAKEFDLKQKCRHKTKK